LAVVGMVQEGITTGDVVRQLIMVAFMMMWWEIESSSVSVVRFSLEAMTEDIIGREVGNEWDCSETVMGMSGLEQREDGSVSMVSGMQGRGVSAMAELERIMTVAISVALAWV
jgi:hypothetical protein